MNEKLKNDLVKRLSRVAGQVNGLSRMVEDGRYCIDILRQIQAAESALHGTGEMILRNHLQTCVLNAFVSEDKRSKDEKIDELVQVFQGMRIR